MPCWSRRSSRRTGEVDVYLPPGRWTHLLTGEEVAGGSWRRERHGFLSLPLYVRAGTLLALGPEGERPEAEARPDRDHTRGLELHLFALEDGCEARAVVRDLRGKVALTAAVARHGRRLAVSLQGNRGGCRLVLRGATASSRGAGAEVVATALGTAVELPPGREELELELR